MLQNEVQPGQSVEFMNNPQIMGVSLNSDDKSGISAKAEDSDADASDESHRKAKSPFW